MAILDALTNANNAATGGYSSTIGHFSNVSYATWQKANAYGQQTYGILKWTLMSQDEKNAVMVKYLEDNWGNSTASNTSQSTTTVPLEGDPGFIGPIQQTGVATGAETATGSGTTVPVAGDPGFIGPIQQTGTTTTAGTTASGTTASGVNSGAGGASFLDTSTGFFNQSQQQTNDEFLVLQKSYNALIEAYTQIEEREKEVAEKTNQRQQQLLDELSSMTTEQYNQMSETYNDILEANEDARILMLENAEQKKSTIEAMLGRDKSALAAQRLNALRARGIDSSNPNAVLSFAQKIDLEYSDAIDKAEADYLETSNTIISDFTKKESDLKATMAQNESDRAEAMKSIANLRASADLDELTAKLNAEDARDTAVTEQGTYLLDVDKQNYEKTLTEWDGLTQEEKINSLTTMLASLGVEQNSSLVGKVGRAVLTSGSFSQALEKISGTVPMTEEAKASLENFARTGEFDLNATRTDTIETSTEKAAREAEALSKKKEEESATAAANAEKIAASEDLFPIEETESANGTTYSIVLSNGKTYTTTDKDKIETIRDALVKRYDGVGASADTSSIDSATSGASDAVAALADSGTLTGTSVESADSVGKKILSEEKTAAEEGEAAALAKVEQAQKELDALQAAYDNLVNSKTTGSTSSDSADITSASSTSSSSGSTSSSGGSYQLVNGKVVWVSDGTTTTATSTDVAGETALEKAKRLQAEAKAARRKARLVKSPPRSVWEWVSQYGERHDL